MHHYTETELEKYKNGKMSFIARMICHFHLLRCKNCRQVLESLEKDEFLIQDIRNHLKNEQVTTNEKTYRKLCKHFHSTTGSTL